MVTDGLDPRTELCRGDCGQSRSTSEIGSRHPVDLGLDLDGSKPRSRINGFGQTDFTAWPGDPSLLKTQDPVIGSGKHKKGRHAKARDTLQGNPGPGPDPEYWIHGPPDPNRETTGSGHYTARADPALPTGTQGDQAQHRSRIIGGPPPLVGVRAKLGSWIQQSRRFCWSRYTTMVRVPGSSGDSGFHRESLEDVQVKIKQGDQASSELGSTTTRLNEVRSTDRQSERRASVGGTEADPDPDLEDKPQLPPQVPSGTPVDLDPRQDPPTKQTKAGRERYGFADSMAKPERYISPSRKSTRGGGIQANQVSTRVKMKAPDPEGEDPIQVAPSWSDVDLEYAFHQKELRDFLALDPVMRMLGLKQIGDLQGPLAPPQMATGKLDAVKGLMSLLKEAGLIAGRFNANDLFDLDLNHIQSSTQGLFDRLNALVGEIQPRPDSAMPDPGLPTHIGSTGCRTASPYVSAAEGSDTSSEPRRMSLGPSRTAMLQARSQIQQREKSKPRSKRQPVASMDPTTSASDTSAGRLETYFQAAMSRFLKKQQAMPSPPIPTGIQNPGSQDVEMESTKLPDPDPHWEYDPDDIELPTTDRAAMATMTTGSTGIERELG
ncbi:unnamed protein product [Phytophthora fragariaefolia]|uniref:Unnamed protein product n=1 Tax=Phytophthora fragariaefolia TaxID=1490495 RepID=A0A9W6Y1S8_9STRA|nr:unnamed protein product [Phytophthora fragariaefolia]